ncbi:MAG: hypothetical protein AAF665_16880 [Pseudomonadota bacterium]
MKIGFAPGDARKMVAAATHDAHLRLHVEPVLHNLTQADITHQGYCDALLVLAPVFCAVEAARLAEKLWPQFSLASDITAMRQDLKNACLPKASLPLVNEWQVLGGLYVTLGSAFGRNSFRATVERAMPEKSTRFVSRHVPANSWRELVSTLDTVTGNQAALCNVIDGAQRSFMQIELLCAALPHKRK